MKRLPTILRFSFLQLAVGSMVAAAPAEGSYPKQDQMLLLAIDDYAFPLRENLTLYLTSPEIRPEPVLKPSDSPDAPDNAATHFYGTVMQDQGKFRMWYYAIHRVDDEGAIGISPVCYAESDDGENWVRPALGQVEWKGSRENNLIAVGPDPTGECAGISVIRDDEDPDPDRRYKMVYGKRRRGPDGEVLNWVVRTAVSPDGLRWTQLPGLVSGDKFAELASLYRHDGLYIVNSHIKSRGEGDRQEGRQGYAWVSTDFENWLPQSAPSFRTAEPVDGSGWGTHGMAGKDYVQVHLGVGAKSLGTVAVGMYGMWYQRQPNWGEGGINCDLGLVVSHDGLHFREVVKGRAYIRSTDSPVTPVAGHDYPTILCQNNSILNVGDETWIYHGRWRNVAFQQLGTSENGGLNIARNYWGEVGLARIPRDRWGALGLWHDQDSGSLWTAPVTLPENAALVLNAAGLSGLSVEVADERFQPIAGLATGIVAGGGDAFDAPVAWSGAALASLAGRTVRFKFDFERADGVEPRLFAATVTTGDRDAPVGTNAAIGFVRPVTADTRHGTPAD